MAVEIPVEMDLSSFIMECERRLGYESLKDKQVEAVSTFMKGNDKFVSLPGYCPVIASNNKINTGFASP